MMSVASSTRSFTDSILSDDQSTQDISVIDPQATPLEIISKLEGSDDANELEHDKFVLLSEIMERFRPEDDVSVDWVLTFIENGGVEVLVNQLLNLALRYDLADMTIFASLVPLSVSLRALTTYSSFLQYFLENDSEEVRETFANILKSGSMMCRREVVLLLTNLMLEDSSSMEFVKCIYDIVSEVDGFTFFPIMRDFETETSDSDYITDIFAFINAYILCQSTFEGRMKSREEFTSFGLLEIIQNQEFKDLLSSSDTQSATALKIQLDFFTQQMADDEAMALQPVHEVITQLSTTEVFSQTKVILQNLLEIYECHHDDLDDNLVKRIFDMVQKLLIEFAISDYPERILRRLEASHFEAHSIESLRVNIDSLPHFSIASKIERISNNKRVNLPSVYEKNTRGNSYPIEKRCFSETCLNDRTLSLPTSLRCTISDADDVIRIRHWSHNELYNNRQPEQDTSAMTSQHDLGSIHESEGTESIVEKRSALNPNEDLKDSLYHARVLKAMERMVNRNTDVWGRWDSETQTDDINSYRSKSFSLVSEESVTNGPRPLENISSREQNEIKKNELDESIETSDINSVGLISEKESEPRSEMKPTTKIKPSLERSKTIEVLLGDDSPNLFEKEVVSFFQSPSMPTSCHVSMAMLNTLVNNKACAEEVTERSFGSAATCCTKAESAFSGVYEIASWSSSPQLSEKMIGESNVSVVDCETQTEVQPEKDYSEKECQTAPYLPPRGRNFPDKQISIKDSSRSDIESKRKEFSSIFYQSLRSPSSLRFKVPSCFQELNSMQSPYTSTPSGSPGAIRRNGDKESVIVAQRLKLMTQQSPGGSPKTDSSRGGTLKQRPFRSDVVIPERNQKFLPLPHWKPGEQGTLRVYHNFTPTEVDTSNGPLVDEVNGYWMIRKPRTVFSANTPSTPGASSVFDEVIIRYPKDKSIRSSISPMYSPTVNHKVFDPRRPKYSHEYNFSYAPNPIHESTESNDVVNDGRPSSLIPPPHGAIIHHHSNNQHIYEQKPMLTKAVNDCFYLVRNTEETTFLGLNHSQQNHINQLQSKENLKLSDFSTSSFHDVRASRSTHVDEHILRLSGSCSVSGKIVAPIKSYPLLSREANLDDDAMVISQIPKEGKAHKKKGAKKMLSNIKKTLIKSTSSSKHNFEGSNHNLQHQEPNEQSASNASSSVAPSSELSRSSYVPSDDDKLSIHYSSLGREPRKPRSSYNHRPSDDIPEALPHHASQPISQAYITESPTSQPNSTMNEKRKSGKLSSKERRSSFSKLKTLFTARPEPETTGNKLNGKKLKSRSSKGINDVSTMSQPFYNPGIDDLTIVKEGESGAWNPVNEEDNQDVFVNDNNDNHLAVPGSHASVKRNSAHADVGGFQGLKELPETNL